MYMGLREQKVQIKEAIKLAEETIKTLKIKEKDYNTALDIASKLDENLQYIELEGTFDLVEFEEIFSNEFLSRELEEISTKVDEIYEEIREFIDEQSEIKQETLEERYCEFETVLEILSQSQAQYESIDAAIEGIKDAIHLLKEMV